MLTNRQPDWSRASIKRTTDLRRFFKSPHCRDLLTITSLAILLAAALGTAVLYAKISGWQWLATWQDPTTLIAAVLGAVFTVCAWAFQSANLRFGAADIFASEIVTLCRISAVTGFIPRLIEGYKSGGRRFQGAQSTQDYVVIFHNNSKDLEILDGSVVTWVTEFYVYFKAMRDTISRLSQLDPSSEQGSDYSETLLSVIYMAFLTFESGRRSLMRLIDDDLERQEAVLIALLNEIPAYILLYQAYQNKEADLRWQRISARLPHYQRLMESIELLTSAELGRRASPHRIRQFATELIGRWREADAHLFHSVNPPPLSPLQITPQAA